MEDKKIFLVMTTMVLFIIAANLDTVKSDAAFDCYDSCSMGCVNPDVRLLSRCDRKCQIKCSQAAAEANGRRFK